MIGTAPAAYGSKSQLKTEAYPTSGYTWRQSTVSRFTCTMECEAQSSEQGRASTYRPNRCAAQKRDYGAMPLPLRCSALRSFIDWIELP